MKKMINQIMLRIGVVILISGSVQAGTILAYHSFDTDTDSDAGTLSTTVYETNVGITNVSKIGSGSMYLNQTDSRLTWSLSDAALLSDTPQFTMMFWAYRTADNLVSSGDREFIYADAYDNNLRLENISGTDTLRIYAEADNGNNTGVFSKSSLLNTVGTWVHVGVQYDLTAGTLDVFMNGVKSGSALNISTFDDVTFGDFRIGAYGSVNAFTGLIDDFAVVKGNLTSQEWTDIAGGQSVYSVLTPPVQVEVPSDVLVYSTFDVSAEHNDGGLLTPELSASSGAGAVLGVSKVGEGSLRLNGTTSAKVTYGGAEFSAADLSSSSQFTVLFWARLAASPAVGASQFFYADEWDNNLRIYNNSGVNELRVYAEGDNGQNTSVRPVSSLFNTLDQWHHVAVEYDLSAGTLKIFIDGIQSGSAIDISTFDDVTFGAFQLGNYGGTAGIDGYIDDFAVISRALTTEELSALAAGGSVANTFEIPPVCRITRMESVSSGTFKLVIGMTGSEPSDLNVVGCTNLISGNWASVALSTNGLSPFVSTNLEYAVQDGTNYTIYVESPAESAFFGIQ